MLALSLALLSAAPGSEDQLALALARRTSPPPALATYERKGLERFARTLPPLSPSELSMLNTIAADVSRRSFERMLSAKAQTYVERLTPVELQALVQNGGALPAQVAEAQRAAFGRTAEALRGIDFMAEVKSAFCARAPGICPED